MTDRGNFLKDPGVDEQFDTVLDILAGHSLKEDQDLSSPFLNLKKARNSFVHGSVTEIRGKTVDPSEAAVFVNGAGRTIQQIRGWLAPEFQWPLFQPSTRFEIGHAFLKTTGDPTSAKQ